MKVKLVIGDWSKDGHSQSEELIFESSHPVEAIQEAYKASCRLTGIQFNHNEDYTGLNLDWQHPEYDARRICTEYEDNTISKLAEQILLSHGIDVKEGYDPTDFGDDLVHVEGSEHFSQIWIQFVKLSLPDLVMTRVKDDVPAINGWWNKNLNVQFGYGLYF